MPAWSRKLSWSLKQHLVVTSGLILGIRLSSDLMSSSLLDLGPTNRISVVSSFNFRKLLFIQLFIVNRPQVRELKASTTHISTDMYSSVSSAKLWKLTFCHSLRRSMCRENNGGSKQLPCVKPEVMSCFSWTWSPR